MPIHVKNWIVVFWIALQAALTLSAAGQSSGTFQEVITWGKKAPGGGTFYGGFLNPPVLMSNGQVYVSGSGEGFRDYSAIFRWSAGAVTAPVIYGQTSPGSGILTGIQDPAAIALGWWAFNGSNSDISQAIYRATNAKLLELAKLTGPAPGGGAFSNLGSPAVSDAGDVAFYAATTGGPGQGIYLSSSGQPPIALALLGGTSPGGGVYSDFSFSSKIAVDRLGQVLFAAETSNNTTSQYELLLGSAAGVQLVATDFIFDFFAGNFSLNNSGQITYVSDEDEGIYFGVPSAMNEVVAAGTPAPGGSPGQTLSDFSGPVLNENGEIAFNTNFTNGVYLWTGSEVELIAQPGAAPGGGVFNDFSAPILNNTGQVAFLASTSGGDRIFIGDGVELFEVIGVGDILKGMQVSTIQLASAGPVPGEGPLNDHGQLVFNATMNTGINIGGTFIFTPGTHWRTAGDGSWDGAGNWTLGIEPNAASNVEIAPTVQSVITGPSANAAVQTLAIGGGISPATLQVQSNTTLSVPGGVSVAANGTLANAGAVTGNVKCIGMMSVGPNIGTGSFHGNVVLGAHTAFKLGGASLGWYDRMIVRGALAPHGVVDVSVVNGFDPQPGNQFKLFTWGSKAGSFPLANLNLPTLASGLSWNTKQFNANGSISVSGGTYFAEAAGVYSGIAQGTTPSNAEAGLFTINVDADGSFASTLTLGGVKYKVSGFFDTNGHYTGAIGKTGETIDLQLDLSNHTGVLSGTISGNATTLGNITAILPGYSKSAPTPAAGRYTLLLPPDGAQTGANYPQGFGYATLNVTATGKVQLAGVLGDGTPVTAGGMLAKDNSVPIYIPLYGKKGSISGLLNIDQSKATPLFGNLNWFKPTVKSGFYTAGFAGLTALEGTLYVAPPAQPEIFPTGLATLEISGGGVTVNPTQKPLQVGANNKVTITDSERFQMAFAKSGLFSGTFYDANGKAWKFSGAVLQQAGLGGGLFKGAGQVGNIDLFSN